MIYEKNSQNIIKKQTGIREQSGFSLIHILVVIFVLMVIWGAVRLGRSLFVKSQPLIDYVAMSNELSRPEDFDPNQNAWPDLKIAFDNLIDMPNDLTPVYKLWPDDMNQAQLKLAADWLSQNEKTIPLLTLAAAKKYSWHPVESKSNRMGDIWLPELRSYRTSAQFLTVKAKFLAVDNDLPASLGLLQTTYKIGSFLTGHKSLIEQLVGISVRHLALNASIEVIYYTNPSEQMLADFQKAISQIKSEYPSTLTFESERLLFLDELQRGFDDEKSIWAMMENIKSAYDVDSNNITKESTLEVYEEAYAYINSVIDKTPFEFEKIGAEEQILRIAKKNPFVHLVMPAFLQVIRLSSRCSAQADALILILAIERFKIQNGIYPDSLYALENAGFIDKIPLDPFSPNPLVYRKTGDSFILYSFAEDMDDDGGKHNEKWTDGDYVFWPVQKNAVNE
ncbi:MAG: hypothetical protein WCZ89_04875 [Phycisphaerae bacterium]